MKISKRLILPLTLVAAVGLCFVGYMTGLWIPNRPAKRAYPIRGIDVSRHQGSIDWKRVPKKDVHFVYIKATEGGDLGDTRFSENWRSSADAGIRRGAYHFYTLKTPGLQQAANLTAVVPNDPNALPPAIDLEFAGNSAARPTPAEFQEQLSEFLAVIRSFYGREPVIYTANDFRDVYLQDYPLPRLWIRSVATSPRLPRGTKWLFWQFSEKGRLDGINGFVDLNVFQGNQEDFDALGKRSPTF